MQLQKHSQVSSNQIKAKNSILYQIAQPQASTVQHQYDRKELESKYQLRQNQYNMKYSVPLIYGVPQQNITSNTKNIQRIVQVPGSTNPASPCTREQYDLSDQKKQSQSLNNSPARQDTDKQDQYIPPKILVPIVSSSQSPRKQNKNILCSNSLIPNQSIQNKGKKTLVLDLDETLIHSTQKKPARFDLNFKIYTTIVQEEFFVSFRPGVLLFLKEMSQYFEIFIWTASIKQYADTIINSLDPQNNLISYRLYRESCNKKGNNYIKDLAILNRKMKDLIIVDVIVYLNNLTACFKFHQENGIQIKDYIGNLKDNELEKLTPFLKFMSGLQDVRDVFKWKTKFENQSSFQFTNMQNEKKVYIQGKQQKQNLKDVSPQLAIQKQFSTQQAQILQLVSQISSKDSKRKEDQVYKNRRSISSILDNHSKIHDSIHHMQNLEHSFGGNQTVYSTEKNQGFNKNVSINPIFQEVTFSKLKIQENRISDEQKIPKTPERVLLKDNEQINKIEKNQIMLLETPQQYSNKVINSSQLNSMVKQSNQYMQQHQLQPTSMKYLDQIDHSLPIQASNRNTPSFERSLENKENNNFFINIKENQINNIQSFILEQSNKKCKQMSNESDQSKRMSDSSLISTQPSSSVLTTNIDTSQCIQNTQLNEMLRISFQNKQQFINLTELSEEKVQLKNQDNQLVSSLIFQKSENDLSTKKEQSESSIFNSHTIPKFLQLPIQPIEKLDTSQSQNHKNQKVYTFEPAKAQCQAQKSQLQIFNQINNIYEKLNTHTGKTPQKQQIKEVPQIKRDPSIQSILMDKRPHSLDIQNIKQQNEQDNQFQQQKFSPKLFDQQQNDVTLNKNSQSQVQNIPIMSSHINISNSKQLQQNNIQPKNDNKQASSQQYQNLKQQSQQKQQQQQNNQQSHFYQFENTQKQRSISTQSSEQQPYQHSFYYMNKQELPIKTSNQNSQSFNQDKVNKNDISLQQYTQTYQVQQRRNASQHVQNSQSQLQQQNNKQLSYYQQCKYNLNESPQIAKRIYSPLKMQRNIYNDVNNSKLNYQSINVLQNTNSSNASNSKIRQQYVNIKTPSTAANSSQKEWDNVRENYSDNKIQCFEDYVTHACKGQSISKQRKYYQPYIQKNNYVNNNVSLQNNYIKIN